MCKYLCEFTVNGVRTEQVVSALDYVQAKKLIEAQYPNARIIWRCNVPKKIS